MKIFKTLLFSTFIFVACNDAKTTNKIVVDTEPNKKEEAVVFFNQGYEFEIRQNYSGAIKSYTKAIAINPKYIDAYTHRGTAKFHLSNIDGAITDYNKAIEINTNDGEIYIGRSIVKWFSSYDGACQDALKAKELGFDIQSYFSNLGGNAEDWMKDLCKYGNYENQLQQVISSNN